MLWCAGHTASLVSKYRPAMPILTLVIPQLKTESMKWKLEGRAVARQCQISRSLFPVLAAPSPSGQSSFFCDLLSSLPFFCFSTCHLFSPVCVSSLFSLLFSTFLSLLFSLFFYTIFAFVSSLYSLPCSYPSWLKLPAVPIPSFSHRHL